MSAADFTSYLGMYTGCLEMIKTFFQSHSVAGISLWTWTLCLIALSIVVFIFQGFSGFSSTGAITSMQGASEKMDRNIARKNYKRR